jgi:tRNA nucleotidyltransferase (CCA-adding enzyme)
MADARGRTGHEDEPYPQADIFRQAFEAARGVDTAAVARSGGKGPEIGEQIRRERIAAIHKLKAV